MPMGDSSEVRCTINLQESPTVDVDVAWHSWLPRAHLRQGRALCPRATSPARAQQWANGHCSSVKLKHQGTGQGGTEQSGGQCTCSGERNQLGYSEMEQCRKDYQAAPPHNWTPTLAHKHAFMFLEMMWLHDYLNTAHTSQELEKRVPNMSCLEILLFFKK